VNWGASRAKSSIDGKLECVISNERYAHRSDSLEKRFGKQAVLYRQFRAGPAERLSGVDLLKRLGDFYEQDSNEKNAESGFPSTSHIATIPYLVRLSKLDSAATSALKQKWDAYIHALEDLRPKDGKDTSYLKYFREQVVEIVKGYHPPEEENICPHPVFGFYDGAMLFHEHFLDIVTDKKHLSTSGEALKEFFKAVKGQLKETLVPYPYYAILLADGDGMGKVIDAQAEKGVEGHQALSQQIDNFAEKAREIVRKHLGATIYAGGDDVLALVPIHTVLACAAQLSDTFKTLLASFKDKEDNSPSLSVGIAIVHHLELLSEALDVARRAEKKAKSYQKWRQADRKWLKKDALAIIVSKRSGEAYDIAGRWGDLNRFLDQLIPLYGDEIIPKGTAYALRESMLRLQCEHLSLIPQEGEAEAKQKKRAVLLAEAERILQRKLLVSDSKSKHRDKAERALGLLEQRLDIPDDLARGNRKQSATETTSTMEAFVHELIVAEMLADAQQLAGTLKKEGK
jgi:CRISPR-associated protein Cmr2